MARILIADDNSVVRRTLRSLLEGQSGWLVCGEASDGLEAVQKAAELQPDLVLMDFGMPQSNGLEAGRAISTVAPALPMLLYSFYQTSAPLIAAARDAGFRGAVVKSLGAPVLLRAVEALLHGGEFFDVSATGSKLPSNLMARAATEEAGFTGLADQGPDGKEE